MRPNRSRVAVTSSWTWSSLLTSTARPAASTPRASTSATTGGMDSAGSEAIMTLEPALAKASAHALPMPPLPPVMMVVRPSREKRERSMVFPLS